MEWNVSTHWGEKMKGNGISIRLISCPKCHAQRWGNCAGGQGFICIGCGAWIDNCLEFHSSQSKWKKTKQNL